MFRLIIFFILSYLILVLNVHATQSDEVSIHEKIIKHYIENRPGDANNDYHLAFGKATRQEQGVKLHLVCPFESKAYYKFLNEILPKLIEKDYKHKFFRTFEHYAGASYKPKTRNKGITIYPRAGELQQTINGVVAILEELGYPPFKSDADFFQVGLKWRLERNKKVEGFGQEASSDQWIESQIKNEAGENVPNLTWRYGRFDFSQRMYVVANDRIGIKCKNKFIRFKKGDIFHFKIANTNLQLELYEMTLSLLFEIIENLANLIHKDSDLAADFKTEWTQRKIEAQVMQCFMSVDGLTVSDKKEKLAFPWQEGLSPMQIMDASENSTINKTNYERANSIATDWYEAISLEQKKSCLSRIFSDFF